MKNKISLHFLKISIKRKKNRKVCERKRDEEREEGREIVRKLTSAQSYRTIYK